MSSIKNLIFTWNSLDCVDPEPRRRGRPRKIWHDEMEKFVRNFFPDDAVRAVIILRSTTLEKQNLT